MQAGGGFPPARSPARHATPAHCCKNEGRPEAEAGRGRAPVRRVANLACFRREIRHLTDVFERRLEEPRRDMDPHEETPMASHPFSRIRRTLQVPYGGKRRLAALAMAAALTAALAVPAQADKPVGSATATQSWNGRR